MRSPALRRADSKYATHSPCLALRSQPRSLARMLKHSSMNIRLLGAALAALALVVSACGKKEPTQELNLYIWNDYLAQDTLANFEKETGIKVSVSNYGSN